VAILPDPVALVVGRSSGRHRCHIGNGRPNMETAVISGPDLADEECDYPPVLFRHVAAQEGASISGRLPMGCFVDAGIGILRLVQMSTEEQNIDLAAALRRLDSWKSRSALSRQRRFFRYPARGQARLSSANPGRECSAISVEVRDISRGGVGVLCDQPAEIGHCWRLNLLDDRVVIASLPVFCRYCRKVIDGAYLIGLEFGAEAGLLMAMGVSAKDIMSGDEMPDEQELVSGDFVAPETVLDSDAA
jgi:hypothetical protein